MVSYSTNRVSVFWLSEWLLERSPYYCWLSV